MSSSVPFRVAGQVWRGGDAVMDDAKEVTQLSKTQNNVIQNSFTAYTRISVALKLTSLTEQKKMGVPMSKAQLV